MPIQSITGFDPVALVFVDLNVYNKELYIVILFINSLKPTIEPTTRNDVG